MTSAADEGEGVGAATVCRGKVMVAKAWRTGSRGRLVGTRVTRPRASVLLNLSQPDRQVKLSQRDRRARVYEIVLREGSPADVLNYIDGALLVDLWDSLVLPRDVRAAWSEVVHSALHGAS